VGKSLLTLNQFTRWEQHQTFNIYHSCKCVTLEVVMIKDKYF
jgi:hypothetical protein